jgi:hypothetical protein
MPSLNARRVEGDDRLLDELGWGAPGDDELTRWLAALRDTERRNAPGDDRPSWLSPVRPEEQRRVELRPRHATRFHRSILVIRVLLTLALLGFVAGVTVAFTSPAAAAVTLAATAVPLAAAGYVARSRR